MPITDIPILSMLRERMQWQQARQQVLAENVANADTPDYQAKDLAPLDFAQQLSAAFARSERTNPDHIADASGGGSQFATGGGGPLRDPAARQFGQPRRRDDEGGGEPDGLRGGHRAVHAQSRPDQACGQRVTRAGEACSPYGPTEFLMSMDFMKSLTIAASGLRAQIGRMRIITENIANANSLATTPGGDPYRRGS